MDSTKRIPSKTLEFHWKNDLSTFALKGFSRFLGDSIPTFAGLAT